MTLALNSDRSNVKGEAFHGLLFNYNLFSGPLVDTFKTTLNRIEEVYSMLVPVANASNNSRVL